VQGIVRLKSHTATRERSDSTVARISLLAVCTTLGIVAVAQGATFNLPVGDAALRLNQWSEATGVQVLFDFNIARFYLTDAVRGTMSPQVALARMLKGTNLTFDWVNERTIAVVEAVAVCRPDSGLPVEQVPLPPCVQGPAPGEKKLARR
jgi:hypothetical protein